eukprot:gene19337-4764_t
MSENFRTRLRDMWNLRALTHTQTEGTELEHGCPREQGHYGFMLTDLFLYPLLSGQSVNMPNGELALSPRYKAPYTLPVLLSNCEASLTATAGGQYTLYVGFGHLSLRPGGLSVNGKAYAAAVDLSAGQGPVPAGKTRICVAGFNTSHHTNRAGKLARAIVAGHPEYESWFYFDSKGYRPGFLEQTPDGARDAKGGRDGLCEWAAAAFPHDAEVQKLTATSPSLTEVFVDATPGTAQ